MTKTNVLVVEDERIVALNLKQRLAKLGYEVDVVTSGAKALERIGQAQPDVVLMDIHIDGPIDGIETASRIPEQLLLPVIYLTAYSEEATLDRARDTMPYGYLLKPFSERELHATIQMALERRRANTLLRESEARLETMVAERTAQLVAANQNLQDEIVQRRKAEEALDQARKLEAVGRLTGGIAHDFNNLLTAVSGSLELIQLAEGDRARIQVLTENAQKGVGRCERLIRQMLMFARQEVLSARTVSLNQLIVEFEGLITQAAGDGIALTLRLNARPDRVRIDQVQFERALLNLVMNARYALSGQGTVVIETATVALSADAVVGNPDAAPGQYVRVTVTDNGPGIAAELLPKVFDPFFTTKETGEGSGLGLSQVYGFTRESGGLVTIASLPGEGATVAIVLPCSAASDTTAAAVADPAPVGGAVDSAIILVVEDDELVRNITVDGLRAMGFHVLVADNAAGALEILRSEGPISILFSDVVMPGQMNGFQLALEARRLRPDIKLLLTSGYMATRPSHPEIDDVQVLPKPYRLQDLRSSFTRIGASV